MLLLVHGDKGGVGKSTVAKAFIHFCMQNHFPVLPIDADTRNPDVHRMFANTMPVERVNLRTEDGWAEMVDLMAENTNQNMIVNLPAGIGEEDDRRAIIFLEAAFQIGTPIALLWVINRGVDSVNQLRHQIERGLLSTNGIQRMICLRNQHFAPSGEPFTVWDDSQTRRIFESRGGITADFPSLSERVVTVLDRSSIPFMAAFDQLNAWDRITLKKWLRQVETLFTELKLPLVDANGSFYSASAGKSASAYSNSVAFEGEASLAA